MRTALYKHQKGRGFSVVELMISMLLFSIVILGAMLAFNKFDRKSAQSSLNSEFAIEGAQISKLMTNDIKNAALLTGTATNDGGQFEATKTYGILPSPFSDVGNRTSDGLQIFVVMPSLSTSSLFDVTQIASQGSCGNLVVSGDFTPTQTLQEDLFVMATGTTAEIFSVSGNISVTGIGSAQISTFSMGNCSASVLTQMNDKLLNDPSNAPKIYRIQRVRYQIGNGVASTGVYRYSNGQAVLVSANAASMQLRYTLSTTDGSTGADCASKSNSRWFNHPTRTTECDWNKVVAVHAEIVLESSGDMQMPANFNPHIPTTVDGKLRYTTHISVMPTNYAGAS